MGKNTLNARLLAMMDAVGVRFVESGDDGGGSGSDRDGASGGQDGKDGGDGASGKDRESDDDGGDGGDDSGDDSSFEDLPERTQKEIKRLRKEGQRRRDEATTARQERDAEKNLREKITKLLKGDDGDGDDPEAVARKLSDLQTENRTMRVERAAEKVIRKHGGDAEAVLDSRGYADKLSKLDPTSKSFDEDLDEITKETVESSDRYKATDAAPKRRGTGSGEHGGRGAKERPKSLRDAYGRRNTKH